MEKNSFPLNYYCALDLLLWLDFDDCMNMAEAFEGIQPIADRVYMRKFNELAFDFQQPIDRVLYHAGPTAKSLTLTARPCDDLQSDLVKIVETCKELRQLTFNEFNMKQLINNPFAQIYAEHLEVLTLNQCSLANDEDFFDSYTNLKCLNLIKCREIKLIAVKKCFERNRDITSFVCDIQYFFDPKLLQLLPSLEKLSLRYNSQYMELDVLSKLTSLRHLTLHCWMENVNDVLAHLGKANQLEELVLIDVVADGNTFPLIKSLHNLHLLTVMTDGFRFASSKDLPLKVKALKLGGCGITDNEFASTVKHLKYLKDIQLHNCELERNYFWMNDFDSIADYIVEEVHAEHAERQLSVALVSDHDKSPEVN